MDAADVGREAVAEFKRVMASVRTVHVTLRMSISLSTASTGRTIKRGAAGWRLIDSPPSTCAGAGTDVCGKSFILTGSLNLPEYKG